MNLFMRKVSSAYSKRVDMLVALGSYFTGTVDNASVVGTWIHGLAGIFFGAVYFLIMNTMNALVFPYAIFLGMGLVFFTDSL